MFSPRSYPLAHLVCLLALLLIPACGSGGAGPAPAPLLPPGEAFLAGAGPVASSVAARLLVLTECLGLTGLTLGDTEAPVEVKGDNDPLDDVYESPGGPFPVGTIVTRAGPKPLPYTCDESYYIYWLDPYRNHLPGHPSTIVYVRESDGAMFKLDAQFAPVIAGVENFLYTDDKEMHRVCSHETMNVLLPPGAAVPIIDPSLTDYNAKFSSEADTRLEGTGIGGLIVIGSPETNLGLDVALATGLYEAMNGGSSMGLGVLQDKKGSSIDEDDLADALKKASMGLGDGDKFFFYLSSHGAEDGECKIGDDWISWSRLCELLEANVTATHVNLLLDTCFSGLAVNGFEPWKGRTEKGVRILTSTDGSHVSFFGPEGSEATSCFVEKLKILLAAASLDGELTRLEIEQVWKEVEVTKTELDQKHCDQPNLLMLLSPTAWAIYKADFVLDGGLFENNRGNGKPQRGGFPSGDESGVRLEMELGPTMGTGTTNDGAGTFDLKLGAVYIFNFEDKLRLRFQANLFRTDATPPSSGWIDLQGDLTRNPTENQWFFDITGRMQVFRGAQVEDVLGEILVDTGSTPGELRVTVNGTHTQGQALQFDSLTLLSAFAPARLGDLDGDGDIDFEDRRILDLCAAGGVPSVECRAFEPDLNGDDEVNDFDMQILQRGFTGSK